MLVVGVALLFSLAAQEAPPPALDAPAPEPPAAFDYAPPIETPPPVATPPAKPAPPPADAKKTPKEPEGLNGFIIGCLQWGTPCVVGAVTAPLMFVPGLGCIMPAVNGYLATFIGDRFGKNRAAAIWPIVASYAGYAVAIVALVVSYVGVIGGVVGIGLDRNSLFGPAGLTAAGIGLGVMALSTLAVPITYAMVAEEKRPGDDGSAMPGFLEPGHPQPSKKGGSKDASGTTVMATARAMAF